MNVGIANSLLFWQEAPGTALGKSEHLDQPPSKACFDLNPAYCRCIFITCFFTLVSTISNEIDCSSSLPHGTVFSKMVTTILSIPHAPLQCDLDSEPSTGRVCFPFPGIGAGAQIWPTAGSEGDRCTLLETSSSHLCFCKCSFEETNHREGWKPTQP